MPHDVLAEPSLSFERLGPITWGLTLSPLSLGEKEPTPVSSTSLDEYPRLITYYRRERRREKGGPVGSTWSA